MIALAPSAGAERPAQPARPRLAKWIDREFAIALSRPQGPVIGGSSSRTDTTVTGDPVKGSFGSQLGWPIVPIHAVLLPDGRVLTYGSDRNGAQTAFYDYDVWDPRLGTGSDAHQTLPNATATDLFCNTQTLLLKGGVELYGGDNMPADTQTYNDHVVRFRSRDNSLVRTGTMNRRRWYGSSTMLPSGEVLVQGGYGGKDYPEVRNRDGTFRLLTGAPTTGILSGYPRNFVAPDGRVFGLAGKLMYRINPAGNGAIRVLGEFPTRNTGVTSTSAMFAPGKILQAGGFDARTASIIDINRTIPRVTAVPGTTGKRKWANATVLADGRVLVSGGSGVNNEATDVAYTAEIFDPSTNTWSEAATSARMRLYHSASLLLPDATVLTMGGGVPGPETNMNAEIYHPSYLFDSSGEPAVRPTIDAATTAARPGTNLSIQSSEATSVGRVTLVKMGSVTHSVDMDQRFLNLGFSAEGSTVTATLPPNAYRTPPGFYMIFIFNDAGVPSTARVVKIGAAPTP